MRPSRKLLAAFGVALAAACTGNPVELCACSLPGPELLAVGSVATSGGAPVAGARMHARVMMPGCDEGTAVAVPFEGQRPQSGADGGYSLRFFAAHAAQQQCVRVVAHRAPGDSAFSAPVLFEPVFERGGPAPRTVHVVFP